MTLQPSNPSGFRLSSLALALAAALALPTAFAQTAPTDAPPPDSAAAPMHEGRPSSDPVGTPKPNTDTPSAPVASASAPTAFKDLDVNKDGKLSRDEVAGDAMWAADFEVADANKDGFVSKPEFRKHEAGMKKTASNDSAKR